MSNTTTDHQSGTTATTQTQYDNEGNPSNITTDIAGIETRNTTITYAPATATQSLLPCRPALVTETNTRNGAAPVTKTTRYTYQNGLQTSRTDFFGLPKNLITVYDHDGYGNVKWQNSYSPSGGMSRWSSFQYDPTGRFIIATTNTRGQASTRQVDPRWGLPLSETAYGNITTGYGYDPFGRLTQRTLPEGYTVQEGLQWSAAGDMINSNCYSYAVEDPTATNQYQHFTPLGKLRETVTRVWETNSGTGIFSNDTTTYDLLNRPVSTQTPTRTGEVPLKTLLTYDDLGRIQTECKRNGQTNALLSCNTYSYTYPSGNLKTEITDLAGRKKYTITDPTGKVIETGDPSGVIIFKYDSWGNVTQTFTSGVLVSENKYDAYNQREETQEASSGKTLYQYDAFGDLREQTDALGRVTYFTYDPLHRLQYKHYDEGSMEYVYYNNGSNGSGNKLWKEIRRDLNSNIEYETEYLYDGLGRNYKTNYGTGLFSQRTYDAYGRVAAMRYSSGILLQNSYRSGLLHEIKDAGGILHYRLQDVNGMRGPLSEWRSNGQTTVNSYQYGASVRYLTPGIQDYQLDYDWARGLISRRRDNLADRHDDFIYDNAARLQDVQTSSNGIAATIPGQQMTYGNGGALSGNILTKSDVGTYDYSFPHRLRYTDNASGAIPHTQQDVTYASFHRPLTITEGAHRVTFRYGTDDERRAMRYEKNGVHTYTKQYLPDGVERTTDGGNRLQSQITYVPGNDGIALIYKQQPGFDPFPVEPTPFGRGAGAGPPPGEQEQPLSATLYYPYTDHLGSIMALTDGQGTVVHRQAFDAWGRRRTPQTWQTDDTQVPAAGFEWLRGYTGHEHLDSFGLINMNARLYDPKMGRMLSVDNYVSAPGTALGYNRYAYALNNPISYTDPDGNWFVIDDAIMGVIGGAINLATNWDNAGNFWQGLGYFGSGFVGGALTTYISPVGSAAVTGALNGALNSYISTGSIDPGAVLQGAATSAIMSGITLGLGGAASPFAEKAFSGVASPVLRGALTQGAVGAGVGAIGGGVGSLMSGGDFWQGVGSGAGWGLGIGVASGAYSGYTTARSMDRNPWTGKSMNAEVAPLPMAPTPPLPESEPLRMDKVQEAAQSAKEWLGEGYTHKLNPDGDHIFMSRDGQRKFRYDIKNPHGDKPHLHLQRQTPSGRWKDAIPGQHRIYKTKLMAQGMSDQTLKAVYKDRTFIIKAYESYGMYYIYIYKDDFCDYDYLQDSIEMCKELALEDFGVPLDAWEIVSE